MLTARRYLVEGWDSQFSHETHDVVTAYDAADAEVQVARRYRSSRAWSLHYVGPAPVERDAYEESLRLLRVGGRR
jgi:hypothetical protein